MGSQPPAFSLHSLSQENAALCKFQRSEKGDHGGPTKVWRAMTIWITLLCNPPLSEGVYNANDGGF